MNSPIRRPKVGMVVSDSEGQPHAVFCVWIHCGQFVLFTCPIKPWEEASKARSKIPLGPRVSAGLRLSGPCIIDTGKGKMIRWNMLRPPPHRKRLLPRCVQVQLRDHLIKKIKAARAAHEKAGTEPHPLLGHLAKAISSRPPFAKPASDATRATNGDEPAADRADVVEPFAQRPRSGAFAAGYEPSDPYNPERHASRARY